MPSGVEGIEFVPVSVGNPHAVVDGDPAEIERIGPLLETHTRASRTGRTSRSRASDGPAAVTARVWERGVGETSSSGTSAVAVAAATQRRGREPRQLSGWRAARDGSRAGKAPLTGPARFAGPAS